MYGDYYLCFKLKRRYKFGFNNEYMYYLFFVYNLSLKYVII